ncbi:MAG: hypothetical protein JWM61_2516 [Micrococcaceae bacterium]|nr:hypothetical protein [Micrococcaceae bacterium]
MYQSGKLHLSDRPIVRQDFQRRRAYMRDVQVRQTLVLMVVVHSGSSTQ